MGSKVCIAIVNRETLEGYRFVGNAKMQSNGEIYEKAAEISKANGMPAPKAVVLIPVEEIHSLKPGPTAGKKIS